jgi:benzoate membrane transport protein
MGSDAGKGGLTSFGIIGRAGATAPAEIPDKKEARAARWPDGVVRTPRAMPLSLFLSPLVSAFVGFTASVAVLIAAAQAIGATPAQTVSMIAALGLAKAAASMWLSWRHRMPVICAWSTPGGALIAATSGLTVASAVGAYVVAALLVLATAAIKPLGRLVARIPTPIASAMLAGVLFRFVVVIFDEMRVQPGLVGLLVAVFLLVRLFNPLLAVLAAFLVGVLAAWFAGLADWPASLSLAPQVELVVPRFEAAAAIGLGVPLYLVTMAAQNLPGFAVLKSAGYEPPTSSALAATGLVSLLSAPFGAHMTNMAAITAAICMGPDTHPDPRERWKAGIIYGPIWGAIALGAGPVLALLTAMPRAMILAVAGLGLVTSLMGALGNAMQDAGQRFAAVMTFAVAASGFSLFGVGAAFWSLVIGLAVLGLDKLALQAGRT